MKLHRRTWFSAPLVAVTASCSSSGKPSIRGYDHVRVDGTACVYSIQVHCPEGASCNPPPPRAVECPPGIAGMAEGQTATIGPAKPGTVDGKCLLYVPPCADDKCGIPTPCLDNAADIAPLAWVIGPGPDATSCTATGRSRTHFDSHPPFGIACPPGGLTADRTGVIERATPTSTSCVVCEASPCPTTAPPVACPDPSAPPAPKIDVAKLDKIGRDRDACVYYEAHGCPPNVPCNPPPPRAIECPPALGKADDAAIARANPGTDDGKCLLYVEPCAELACAVPTPCPGYDRISALAWTIKPGSDGRCIATSVPRTMFDGPVETPVQCPAGGAIERPNAGAPCVTCAKSPCPMTAPRVECPDVQKP